MRRMGYAAGAWAQQSASSALLRSRGAEEVREDGSRARKAASDEVYAATPQHPPRGVAADASPKRGAGCLAHRRAGPAGRSGNGAARLAAAPAPAAAEMAAAPRSIAAREWVPS